MPNIKYIARVLTGVRWKKMNYILGVVKDKCGQSKVRTFFDILWCAARYGAGYYDYAMYGFYDLTGKQRDTYLTRVRNRKVSDLMNDPAFHDDFDDKLRFNETFRRFLRRETLNIALVGMPSCGKSTLGRLLAKQLGRPLVDLDEEIVKADGRSIPDIFAAEGEEGFRAKEAAQITRFGKEKGLVLSCGGGAVKRAENVRALRQNGVVLFIDRPVEALAVGGNRPLSSSAEALRIMEAQRRPLYLAAADAVISNTGTLAQTLAAAQEALDEIFDS